MESPKMRSLSETRLTDPEPTLTAVHHVLAHPTRRAVLRDLTAHYHPVTVHDLAARLPTALPHRWTSEDAFEECRIGLVHHHLPKMEAVGVIRYTETDAVALTDEGVRADGFRRTGQRYLAASEEGRYPLGLVGND